MRYRLERADIESEIDSDLDTGANTFCCIPRFVAHWHRRFAVSGLLIVPRFPYSDFLYI